mmetsp:Transcript_26458/g.40394  ORF Transcript_26458/g.40394 Transcript_26458/m.40394 type:complete len:91 (+) Transcript_26458:448-720(+)|eukprot:CAMPEP_0170510564 /NCGR_PEP_ID=MMETSP0208-20121228/65835_1 /TAXON_ID=197538 /ORGANISM="Strombidium inclinatum, Strain S3" /LENGTH=90 /DNA_ID=CAMNT_0010794039 /DNA_START=654 /DNA_END=926 /DNA_ORIENTATION=+
MAYELAALPLARAWLAEFEGEHEAGPVVIQWIRYAREADLTLELVDKLLGDYEAETDTFRVHRLRIFDEAEEFEKLILVLVRNANARIQD